MAITGAQILPFGPVLTEVEHDSKEFLRQLSSDLDEIHRTLNAVATLATEGETTDTSVLEAQVAALTLQVTSLQTTVNNLSAATVDLTSLFRRDVYANIGDPETHARAGKWLFMENRTAASKGDKWWVAAYTGSVWAWKPWMSWG